MIKKGVVIVTWSGGVDQCKLLMHSLGSFRKYEFYLVINDVKNAPINWMLDLHRDYNMIVTEGDYFECGAISAILEQTDLEEFILLQDTIEIKNPYFMEQMFNHEGQSVSFGPRFEHYLGKYRREVLESIEIPTVITKWEAIQQEIKFNNNYIQSDPREVIALFEDFNDSNPDNRIERRWGRANLVLENKYLIKRKATWANET
jgi:hypothetical protein